MSLIKKISLKNASGTDIEYDIGAAAENVAYDNEDSIKDKVDDIASSVSDVAGDLLTLSGTVTSQGTAINNKLDKTGGSLAATVAGSVTSQASSSDITAADNAALIWGKFNALRAELGTHANSSIYSATGAHGMRFYQNKLQIWDTATSGWVTVPTGGAEDVGLSVVNGQICITYEEE